MWTAHISRIVTPLLLGLAGCAQPALELPALAVDVSPVDCGYKWFQTGYSPRVRVESCETGRDELRNRLTVEAVEHAWDTARVRCPVACPPAELSDTVEWENPLPDGSCKDDRLHYITRVFFQCDDGPGPVSGQPLSTAS
jgi:hypothetical protein